MLVTKLWSHDHTYNMIWVTWKNFVGDVMAKNYDNTFILRRPRLANFAGIIKIATIFTKTTFKHSKKVKRIGNYALKCNLYLYFLI